MECDLAHIELEPKRRNNIEFAYYPSGHMIYLNVMRLKQFKKRPGGVPYARRTQQGRQAASG